jgi:hypothetical protein
MTSERAAEVTVRLLDENELDDADRIVRDAFGTFLGVPDVFGDRDFIRTRYRSAAVTALGAHLNGELVGSNIMTRWGSVGFFGPLSVRPDLWDRGVAGALLGPTMDLFSKWGTRHEGLFTFANSPKHIGLYQRFGFRPRYLTAVMSKPVQAGGGSCAVLYSASDGRAELMASARELTSNLFDGFDVTDEVDATDEQRLGDTVLVLDGRRVVGLAVCHAGPGTEAGSGSLYVKVGVVASGDGAAGRFAELLDSCEALAADRQAERIDLGISLACAEAHDELVRRGFRANSYGIAMHRPNEPAFHDRGCYVIDDWR